MVVLSRPVGTESLESHSSSALVRVVKFNYRFSRHLGEAKDDTAIEEFLVKKLQKDNCLQKGGHCLKVDCSAVRWNMVNIVLAFIRWRGAAEDGRFLKKEQLLGIAVEYGLVKFVQHLSKMHDVNVNIKTIHIWHAVTCLGDWTTNNARLTDQENRFSDHFVKTHCFCC